MCQDLQVMLREAGEGDPEAWRKIIQAYSSRVFGLLYRQCGDAELAEEISQATFVHVVEKLGDYQEQGRFESWLFRIAMNLLRDEMRRRRRQARPTDLQSLPPTSWAQSAEPGPEQSLEKDEQARLLRAAVQELSEADRQIIYLRYTAELTFNQIAELLDEPLGTLLARGHRALKKVKQKLEALETEKQKP